jgi:sulfur carrier protein ThiS
LVKLILRDKVYEVKPGMNLLAALEKCNIVPESVIATRSGEMILDDEILKDGDVVKLVAVISGGSMSLRAARGTVKQSPGSLGIASLLSVARNNRNNV